MVVEIALTCSLLDSQQERQDRECTFWRTSATGEKWGVSSWSNIGRWTKRLPECNFPIRCWSFEPPWEVADPQAPQESLNRNGKWIVIEGLSWLGKYPREWEGRTRLLVLLVSHLSTPDQGFRIWSKVVQDEYLYVVSFHEEKLFRVFLLRRSTVPKPIQIPRRGLDDNHGHRKDDGGNQPNL